MMIATRRFLNSVVSGVGRSSGKYASARCLSSVSTLTHKRGSDGMGLPGEMSQATIDTIVATTPAVAPHVLDITKNFYGRILGNHLELLEFFNPAHNVPISDHQPKALAGSVAAYATNITDLSPLLGPKGPVAAICHRHCALAIFPDQYVVVHENLMAAIGEVLGDAVTTDVAAGWSEAVLFLAKACIDTEESLYKMAEERSGGWSGFIDFEVSNIVDMTDDVKQVTFKPKSGSKLDGSKFEFTPGQYISLKIDIDNDGLTAPRHYTCTAPINENYLQCTVKKVKGGKVSGYIHDSLKVGDTVQLTPPYGIFTPDEAAAEDSGNVLVSAGIGVTPMVNLHRSLDDVKLVAHVDRTPDTHPYKSYFDESGTPTLYKYTQLNHGGSSSSRPSSQELATDIINQTGTNNNFYVCGPEQWMDDIQSELLELDAKNVMCEVFGSQLATGCPFKAGSA